MTARLVVLAVLVSAMADSAIAQVRMPRIVQQVIPALRQGQQPQPQLIGIDALRADFAARSGGTTVYFAGDSAQLVAGARTQLAAQAQWLRQHPEVAVRIEGHANALDTRSHAMALGARRAEEVRSYLVLLGVPAAQLTATSLGKEQPAGANSRVETVLVR